MNKKNKSRYLFIYKQNSIYIRMLLIYATILMAALFIVGSFSYYRSSEIIVKKVININLQNLQQIRQTIEFAMKKVENLTLNMVNDPYLKEQYNDLSLEKIFYMTNQFFPKFYTEDYIQSIYIYYQESGKIITTDDGVIDIKIMEDLDWLSTYNKLKPLGFQSKFINRTLTKNETATECITSLRGFPIINSKEIGAIVTNINKNKLFSIIKPNEFDGQKLFILGDSGELLKGDSAFYQQLSQQENYKNIISAKNSYGTLKLNNKDTVILVVYSDTNGWIYINTQDISYLNKEIKGIRNFTIILVFVCLLVGISVFGLFANKIYRPIMHLIEKAMQNQDKNDANDNIKAQDEIELLNALMERIIISRDNMEDFYTKSQNAVLQKALLDLCYGDVDEEDYIIKYLKVADFPIGKRKFVAIVIQIEKGNDVSLNTINRDVITKHNSIGYDVVVTCMEQDKIVCLISFKNKENIVLKVANEMRNLLREECDVECTVGIGNTCEKLSQFHLSFHEALDALKYKGFLEKGSIIHINSFEEAGSSNKYYYPMSKEDDLVKAIKLVDKDRALGIVSDIYKSIIQSNGTIKSISLLLWQSMNGVVRSISSMGISYDDIMEKSFYNDFAEYNELDSIDAMYTFIQNKVALVIDYISQKRNYNNELVIEKIKKYIDEHCDEDLSLDVFATMTMLSHSYISSMFKTFSNDGLRNYIKKARMERAQKLLLSSNKRSIELVAQSVGYDNVHSFSRAFKEYYGLTPSEYRKNNSQNTQLD